MAMGIKNNMAAQSALGELKKNNDKLGKDLKKVASGMKINGAADDASGSPSASACASSCAGSIRTTRTRRMHRAS